MRAPPAVLIAVLLAASPAASSEFPEPLLGHESVAAVEGADALAFNPAALGLRYPSELLLALEESGDRARGFGALAMTGPLAIGASGDREGAHALTLGFSGGGRKLRIGASLAWLDVTGGRATTPSLGLLARPSAWLSLGATAAHLSEPRLAGARLARDYTLGLGFRPLALVRARAFSLGPRLTLTGDVRLAEDDPSDRARVRVGGELELVPGVVLRGSAERGGYRAGFALLGLRSGYHGHAAYDRDDHRRSTTHAISLHAGEDRTLLAGPRQGRVAVVHAAGALGDEALGGFSFFGGAGTTRVALLHRQLERALEDPLTRGVLLEPRGIGNLAQIEELRVRITRLRAAGKPVVAYLENGGGRGDLYLASACDRVVASEEAVFAALGLRAERRSYRSLLASWGLRIDRASVGAYKSAYRNFSVDSTTALDREQIERQLEAHQRLFVTAVAMDRHMSHARLEGLLDGRSWPASELAKAGLIDSVGYRENALAMLGRLSGLGAKPKRVALLETPPARRPWLARRSVAVVYASGGIEAGRDGHDVLNGEYMGSESVARRLERAFRDPEVKAVVLRVESPGGSGLGSNLILHAASRLKRETKKPLVVSMGGVAASGGYYISMAADRIFADRFTRTGSIGVLFVKPSLEGWYAKHGVKQEAFEHGGQMGAWSMGRDWTPYWQAAADSAVGFAYQTFKARVAEGRRLSLDQVEAVAQGQVWMGEEARERRLVDAIGGLEDAIAEARRLAHVPVGERIELAEIRRPPPGLFERLAGMAVSRAMGTLAPPELLRSVLMPA